MKYSIKQASTEDAVVVGSLFDSYRVFYKQNTNPELALEYISERLTNKESIVFLAQDEKNVGLGFTQLYPTFSSVSAQKSWILNDLYVSKNARKMGIARELMAAAHEFAIGTGANGIALETAKDNINAQALYESLGDKRSTGYYNYFLSF